MFLKSGIWQDSRKGTRVGRLKGFCPCGNKTESKGRSTTGKQTYGRLCTSCRKTGYSLYKKNVCEICGFIPIHKCQLDVDHIDGNHKNNNINNLRTLCANCHRLKTYVNQEHIPKEARSADV